MRSWLVLAMSLAALSSAQAQPKPAILGGSLSAERCVALANVSVQASDIALPTRGAQFTAKPLAATPQVPAYCLVEGDIAPIDSAAPPIHFKVALPFVWSGKALGFGGGGFNGSVPVIDRSFLDDPAASPLARGYATFASDSGHKENPAAPGDFMTNAESLRNYMGDAIKKTRDTAVAVMRAAYGRGPARSYFVGGSTGGREALQAAGRWPEDWDAIASFFPARGITTMLSTLLIDQAFAKPGAFVPPAKRALLLAAAMEACDGLDGVRDGLISNVHACEARFDPARATYQGKPLRCPKGKDAGDTCLADAQLAALAVMEKPIRFDYLPAGDDIFLGYNTYTSDLGINSKTPIDQAVLFFGLGLRPPAFPVQAGMSHHFGYDDNFLRYGVVNEPGFNPLEFDPLHPDRYTARIVELAKIDTYDLDLTRFARRGGKLIILHGNADTIISARMTEHYVAQLRNRMGTARTDAFLRFYEVPGYSHGVSNTFNASWDFLAALENWSERNIDPAETQVVADRAKPGRTRPLCLFPRWPKYRGTGDLNSAVSFACAK